MVESKTALVTGAHGMDGSHLADLLVEKGYEVHGLVRRHSQPNTVNIDHLLAKDAIRLHEGDLTDYHSVEAVVQDVQPDEVFNMAAQSHVHTSFSQPEFTLDVTGLGAMRVFEAVRQKRPQARVYQASSSEMYGQSLSQYKIPATRGTAFAPVSPYGAAKCLAHHMAQVYRKSYGLHVSCGILFNHEGPRRGVNFVTRKITRSIALMQAGEMRQLRLGNLKAVRDWGYAPEYMEAVWKMLQQSKPWDYIVATGQEHTVASFVEEAWKAAGMGGSPWDRVVSSKDNLRPADIEWLMGNPTETDRVLGWKAQTGFEELVKLMVEHDIAEVKATHG